MREASYGVTAVLASALALAPSAQAADDAAALLIGNAGGLSGQVQLASAAFDAERRPVGRQIGSGDPIYQGDQIVTGPGGRVQLMLLDQTIITLGENARMTVDEISFGPTAADGKISVGVEQGAFRFISGQVAQAKPENVNIRIPMGNIGIRGTIVGGVITPTSILVALLGPGSQTNSFATHGAIAVSTPSGSVDITRTGYSTILVPGLPPSPPVVLTPAQIQMLTAAPALAPAPLPPATTPPPDPAELGVTAGAGFQMTVSKGDAYGRISTGAGESAGALSGQSVAVGAQFATNLLGVSMMLPPAVASNLVASNTASRLEQDSHNTLAQLSGVMLPYKFGANYRTIQDNRYATGSDTDHSYSIIASDPNSKSFLWSDLGIVLNSFDSRLVALPFLSYDNETKIKEYFGGVDRKYEDYRNVSGLLYSTYGLFVDSVRDGSNTTYAYTAIGTGLPTPSVQMPSSGTATYTGGTVGTVAIGSGTSGVSGTFTGSALLTANFAARTISGILSGLSTTLPSVTMGNITLGSASISGSGFSGGTASGSVTKTSTSTATGSFAGGFNGANAAEVAGTYAMNNASSQVSVVGSFGAKK